VIHRSAGAPERVIRGVTLNLEGTGQYPCNFSKNQPAAASVSKSPQLFKINTEIYFYLEVLQIRIEVTSDCSFVIRQ
jgi:hypothetical protein